MRGYRGCGNGASANRIDPQSFEGKNDGSQNIDVMVMGAVSRRGLDRIFLGSTAERVLDRLPCDLLIVKPEGFQPTGS